MKVACHLAILDASDFVGKVPVNVDVLGNGSEVGTFKSSDDMVSLLDACSVALVDLSIWCLWKEHVLEESVEGSTFMAILEAA